jgi:hypothetical protein
MKHLIWILFIPVFAWSALTPLRPNDVTLPIGSPGPGTVEDGSFVLWDGDTGNILKAATGTGPVKATNGVYSTSAIDLTGSEVTGVLPANKGGTGASALATNGQMLIGNGSGWSVSTLTGTANQVNVTNGVGSVTLSAPQDIATTSDVTFESVIATTSLASQRVQATTSAGLSIRGMGGVLVGTAGAGGGQQLVIEGALQSRTSLMLEDPGAGTNSVTIQAPTLGSDYTMTLPTANSTGLLKNNGSGVLSFSEIVNADISSSADIDFSKLADLSGQSVLGRSTNTSGELAAITASVADAVLRQSGSSIGFGLLVNANIDSAAAIAGSKVVPNFVGQNISTSGSLSASKGSFANGLATDPSITFNIDDDTGFFRAAANKIGFATGGVEKASLDENGVFAVNTASPSASAQFQVDSTTRGLLGPRMTEAQRDLIGTPAAGLQIYNTDTNQLNIYNGTSWGAVGGGTFVDDFTGTSITATNDSTQVWRYTGASAQVLASVDVTALPDGAIIEIMGTDNDDTITLNNNDTAGGWLINGTWVGYRGSKITLRRDAGLDLLVEVSRNGI